MIVIRTVLPCGHMEVDLGLKIWRFWVQPSTLNVILYPTETFPQDSIPASHSIHNRVSTHREREPLLARMLASCSVKVST